MNAMNVLQGRLERWRIWRMGSTNRRIFAAILTVGSATLLVRLTAIAKELIIAHQFGASDALDAFFIAALLPLFTVTVVATSFNAALIPTYIRLREHAGKEHAQRVFSSTTAWSTVLLLSVSALLGLAFPFVLPLLGSSFSPAKLALTRSLFFILLPLVALNGVATIWTAVLNAGEKFAWATITLIITPIVAIFFLLMRGKVWGIYSLAGAMVVGAVLEVIWLGYNLRHQGISLFPRWYGWDTDTLQVMRQYAPMTAGALMMSSTHLVDQSMAAMLGSGSVSALNYGSKMVMLVVGIGSMAVGTAVMPHFSMMVAHQAWADIRHTLHFYLRLLFLITVPLTVMLILLSEQLVRALFERGAFGAADTHMVAQIQMCYALQIPFYIAGILVVRLISSLQANTLLMWGAILNLIVNIVLDYLFMKWLGVAGIALSTAVVHLLSFAFLCMALNRRMATIQASK